MDKLERLRVYEEVLNFLETEKDDKKIVFGMTYAVQQGLCLPKPLFWRKCFYEENGDILYKDENGNFFHWSNTGKFFPEFDAIYQNDDNDDYEHNIQYRIKILKEIINGLKECS